MIKLDRGVWLWKWLVYIVIFVLRDWVTISILIIKDSNFFRGGVVLVHLWHVLI